MRFLKSHKAFLLLVVVNAAAFVILSAVARPAPSFATPTVGVPVASPATIPVEERTVVTVTSQITTGPGDPPVIPTSVYLQRLDAAGKVIANLGTMRDDGAAGDAMAGDGVFTVRVTLNEANPDEVRLRVSAAFRKLLRRVLSPVGALNVWNRVAIPGGALEISYPPTLEPRYDGLGQAVSFTQNNKGFFITTVDDDEPDAATLIEWANWRNWMFSEDWQEIFDIITVSGMPALRNKAGRTVILRLNGEVYFLQNGVGPVRGEDLDKATFDAMIDSIVISQ